MNYRLQEWLAGRAGGRKKRGAQRRLADSAHTVRIKAGMPARVDAIKRGLERGNDIDSSAVRVPGSGSNVNGAGVADTPRKA